MEATQIGTQTTPCSGPLPQLEVPMIHTMVTCLGTEHRRLTYLILQLTSAAIKLVTEPNSTLNQNQWAIDVWDEIRSDLWSHLQIEDGLVFWWGEAHGALSRTLRDTLKNEREEMRKLIARLPASSSSGDRKPPSPGGRGALARTLFALGQALDSHVGRYDGEVLPSVLRALSFARSAQSEPRSSLVAKKE